MTLTRTSKLKVSLNGGPYHGHIVKISTSKTTNRWVAESTTFMFTAKGQTGMYIGGRWKRYEDPNDIQGCE